MCLAISRASSVTALAHSAGPRPTVICMYFDQSTMVTLKIFYRFSSTMCGEICHRSAVLGSEFGNESFSEEYFSKFIAAVDAMEFSTLETGDVCLHFHYFSAKLAVASAKKWQKSSFLYHTSKIIAGIRVSA